MVDIKNIRVLPTSLDIKSNVGKSSTEILSQLQSGSNLKAVVIQAGSSGNVIFNSNYGKFSAPNNYNLTIGDSVNFRVSNQGSHISGSIISINDQRSGSNQSLKLELIRPHAPPAAASKTNPDEGYVTLNEIINTPKVISGIISYLNLSNIAKSSSIFKLISQAMEKDSTRLMISANILPKDHIPTAAHTFRGLVSSNGNGGIQLIKTDFGIISVDGATMPIGKKLLLEITGLNDKLIDNELSEAVTDFVYKLTNSDLLIENMISPLILLLKEKNKSAIVLELESSNESEDNNLSLNDKMSLISKTLGSNATIGGANLNNLISLLKNDKEIKSLMKDYSYVKQLLTPFIKEPTENTKWQTIYIPIYNNNKIIEQEIKIDTSRENHLKFIFNVELQTNEIQIEGLIGFEDDGRTPKSFDMILRPDIKLDPEISKNINEIFKSTQNMTGLRGSLTIEGSGEVIKA